MTTFSRNNGKMILVLLALSLFAVLAGLAFGPRVGLGAPQLSAWLSGAAKPRLTGKSLLGPRACPSLNRASGVRPP